MVKSQQVIDVSSREEKIRKIRILISKAKGFISKQQEIMQKFIEDYVGDETDERLVDLRVDLREKVEKLSSELVEVIIEIAKEAKGLEEVRIDLRRLDIIDLKKEGPA